MNTINRQDSGGDRAPAAASGGPPPSPSAQQGARSPCWPAASAGLAAAAKEVERPAGTALTIAVDIADPEAVDAAAGPA